MKCPRCAKLVPAGAASCPACGAPIVAVPSDVTMTAKPMGGARPAPEVDDIASTLVWQKGADEGGGGVPAGAAGMPPTVATFRGTGDPGAPPPGGARPAGPPAPPLAATAVANMGATAVANMMAATAVGMPPIPEEPPRSPGAPSASTIVGVPRQGSAPAPPARIAGPHPAVGADPSGRTLVGVSMPGSGFEPRGAEATARQLPPSASKTAASAAPVPAPAAPVHAPVPSGTAGGGASTLPQRVMGGADPGPRNGPVPPARAAPPRSAGAAAAHAPAPRAGRELGATGTPALAARKVPGVHEAPRKKHPLDKRVVVAPPRKGAAANRTAVLAIAGGVAALVAVLVVLLWPGRAPVVVRQRVDAEGREGLDVECATCPDSTSVRIGSVAASVVGHHAFLPISLPLGESKLELAIDRPGNGKDEVTKVSVHLPYRVTTDLATLRGERPSIQVVVEAQDGTQVTLDGRSVPLVAGRAIDMLDVTEACTGESDEARTLSRKIPYVVTPPGRSPEQGTLHVSVPITTLRINAPGPAVVTEKESFVLAGRTAKGVELFAGPHSIPLRPDGTFAHVMNVSAVGATQIAVRAQAPGMAPRIVKIDVRRVESLDAAAREFASRSPLALPDFAADVKSKVGRSAMVSGLILGSKSADQVTVLKLRGYGGPACPPLPPGTRADAVDPGPCVVEIAVGAQVPYGPGELVTGCGRFAGTTGGPGNEVPQVRADFLVKGVL